jgi:hypothetical protein
MTGSDPNSPEVERKYLFYSGHEIPWYVHALWISFWLFAVSYMLMYAMPIMRSEVANPP